MGLELVVLHNLVLLDHHSQIPDSHRNHNQTDRLVAAVAAEAVVAKEQHCFLEHHCSRHNHRHVYFQLPMEELLIHPVHESRGDRGRGRCDPAAMALLHLSVDAARV